MTQDNRLYKRTCILTIECGEREWNPTIFLANELCKRGYRVLIATNRAVKVLENKISSSVFLHKSTIDKYALRYQSTLGAKVCFLDTESGITVPDHRYGIYCEERFKNVSKEKYHTVFTIGEKYRSTMAQLPQFNGVKLVASGWPRLELLTRKQRSFYDQRVQELKAKYGKFTLAISSFGFVNIDEYEKWAKVNKAFFGKDHKSPAWPFLQKFIDLLKTCDKKIDTKIILRPHPAEFISSWKTALGDLSNVEINLDGDIVPWLIAADTIIQFRSSTALEAALLEKESLALSISSIDFETNSPIYRLNTEFETTDELISYINSKKITSDLNSTVISTLSNYISNLDASPTKIIADELDLIELEKIAPPQLSLIQKFKHSLFMFIVDCIEAMFFNTFLSPPSWKYLFTYIYKRKEPITRQNCETRVKQLADGTDNLQIEQISRDLVSMEMHNEA